MNLTASETGRGEREREGEGEGEREGGGLNGRTRSYQPRRSLAPFAPSFVRSFFRSFHGLRVRRPPDGKMPPTEQREEAMQKGRQAGKAEEGSRPCKKRGSFCTCTLNYSKKKKKKTKRDLLVRRYGIVGSVLLFFPFFLACVCEPVGLWSI